MRTEENVQQQQPYVQRVQVAAAAAGVQPGTVTLARVQHDDWCGFFRGRPCNCDPHVTLERLAGPGEAVAPEEGVAE
jgi:hypothetical protein